MFNSSFACFPARSLLAVALLAAALGADPPPAAKTFEPIDISGELAATDARDRKRNVPCKLHRVYLLKGRTYVIDMISKSFDTYLRLEGPDGTPLAEDDDSGGNLNSRIIHMPAADGDYQISATTYNGQVGPYLLKVQERK